MVKDEMGNDLYTHKIKVQEPSLSFILIIPLLNLNAALDYTICMPVERTRQGQVCRLDHDPGVSLCRPSVFMYMDD